LRDKVAAGLVHPFPTEIGGRGDPGRHRADDVPEGDGEEVPEPPLRPGPGLDGGMGAPMREAMR